MRRGLSQGGRWLFKRVFGRKTLAEGPPSGSSAPIFNRSDAPGLPPSPSCCSLTSDVSKIPNGPIGLRARPHQTGKVKIWGTGTATCHASPPRAQEPGGAPAAHPEHRAPLSTTPRTPAPGEHLPRTPSPLPAPRRLPRRSQETSKRDDCGERRERRVPGPGRPPAALNSPRGCVSAGPT